MRFLSPYSSLLRRAGAALALSALMSSALAVPVMEMRAEDYLPMAAELKKSLNLNPNQQTLWSQTETKTRNLLRERKARRERLQEAVLKGAQAAGVELREVSKALDEETTATANEEKLLREWWLTVNDALTEQQRQVVAQTVVEQLLRVPDNGASHGGGEPRRPEGGGEKRGGGHRGGMGGMGGGMGGSGGVGVGVGPGGASVNLPGGSGE